MIEIGSVVGGKYRILGEVGRGGMGVVYLALNEQLNKTWAIKAVKKEVFRRFMGIAGACRRRYIF